ncbi:ABC-2 type transport system permease protein [Stackebrandtia albiflava]|uniref:ABC-2 type transport system permease protein n=1 Tax=Stackebrandtia albiflava TaxID=406432 RepID=A0A562V2D5_9ACTN|nr:ABC transporter permease [Stackebrandtia albiflava]TWJ12070.1 ABC-2 type transport system permease protein [Stackebrandtia albiflava]
MTSLTGTGGLIRFILRRDRFLLPVWIVFFGAIPAALAPGITEVWPTQADRDAAVGLIENTPAFTALLGRVFDSSIGGLVAWRGSMMPVLLGIVTAVTVIRHTRTDEEAGRRELLGSTVVGRQAGLTAALVVVTLASLATGALAAASMIGQDEAVAGSLLLGAQYAAGGVVFAAVAAVCAQLTRGAGSARGMFFLVLGAAFALRMTGDLDPDATWATWASPVGWLQQLQPYADDDWAVLALPAAATLLLTAAAFLLQSHRDVEAGVLPTRLGRAEAGPGLSHPTGLAWRLQRAGLLGWSIGFAALGLMLGSMVDGVQDMLDSSEFMQQVIMQMGGSDEITEAFIASMLGILGLVAAGYGIQAALKPRAEETGLRAEQLLATGVSRLGWTTGHLLFAYLGPAVVMAAGGVTMALSYGAVVDDFGTAVSQVAAGLAVQLPAIWVLTGLAVLLFGLAPRLLGLTWVALTLCLVFGQLGAALRLPQWALDLSPFTHIPQIPGEDPRLTPVLWLVGVAAAMTVAGLAGFRRRDVG